MSGGGQAILNVSLIPSGSAFTAGTVTAKTQGAPGNLLTVVMSAASPAVAKNMLAVNTTRSSQAIVDSISGTTATMQQPQTTASLTPTTGLPAPVEDNTWTTGDTIQLYSLLNVNLKQWSVFGGDLTSGGKPTSSWIFYASINDSSTNDTSQWQNACAAAACVLVNSVVNSRMAVSATGGRGQAHYIVGSSIVGLSVFATPISETLGGSYANGINWYFGSHGYNNDAIIHGATSCIGAIVDIATAFSDGTLTMGSSFLYVTGVMWGSYNVTLYPSGQWVNETGSTFVLKALLTSGTLKFGNITTGSKYQGSGVWVDGVTLTPANIDTGGTAGVGLTDLLTGARFSDVQ
jgi:hypothetical protein